MTRKGQKQVGQIASAERDDLITMAMAILTVSGKIPPFFYISTKEISVVYSSRLC